MTRKRNGFEFLYDALDALIGVPRYWAGTPAASPPGRDPVLSPHARTPGSTAMTAFSTLPRGIVRALPTTLSLSTILLVLLVFTGCTPNGQRKYREEMSNLAPNRVLTDKSQTLRYATANRMALPFREKFDLRSGDVVRLGSFYSYFRTFRLDVDSGAVYRVGARGLCSFWQGLVVIPLIYVLDDKGGLVAEGPSDYTFKKVFPGISDDVIKSFDFSPRTRGSVFILIAADNAKVGRGTGSVGTAGSFSMGGGVSATTTGSSLSGMFWPVGAVRLQVDQVPAGANP